MTSVVSRDICPAHHRGSTHGSSAEGLFRKGIAARHPARRPRRGPDGSWTCSTTRPSPAVPRHRRWPRCATRSPRPAPTRHTRRGAEFGARVAWRNSRALHRPAVLEAACGCATCATCATPADVAARVRRRTCASPPRDGRIRSTITVFAPDRPGRPGPRIHNEQLVRYAGYRMPAGGVRGDRRYVDFTDPRRRAGLDAARARRGRVRRAAALIVDGGRRRAGHLRVPRRRRARGAAGAPRAAVVRRPAAALARRARDQQHAAAHRRDRPTPRRRSTAGTSAPRSAPATSPTPTATTCCR